MVFGSKMFKLNSFISTVTSFVDVGEVFFLADDVDFLGFMNFDEFCLVDSVCYQTFGDKTDFEQVRFLEDADVKKSVVE